VAKAYGTGSNQVYGTAGYYQIRPTPNASPTDVNQPVSAGNDLGILAASNPTLYSVPSFATSTGKAGSFVNFGPYPVFRGPNGSALFRQGALAVEVINGPFNSPAGNNASLFGEALEFTVTSPGSYRVGLVVDAVAEGRYSPNYVGLYNPVIGQTVFSTALVRDGTPDMVFFDVTAKAGDTFTVGLWQNAATQSPERVAALSMVTFDNLSSSPSTLAVVNGDFQNISGLTTNGAAWFNGVPTGWTGVSGNFAVRTNGTNQYVANLQTLSTTNPFRPLYQSIGTMAANGTVSLNFDIIQLQTNAMRLGVAIYNAPPGGSPGSASWSPLLVNTNFTSFGPQTLRVSNVAAGTPLAVAFWASTGAPGIDNVIVSDSTGRPSGWTNGANGGFGFQPWTIVASNGTGGFAGHFIGNPAEAGISGMNTNSFGMFANPTNSGCFVNVGRGLSNSLPINGTLSFQWGINFDSGAGGNKGFSVFSGTNEIINVNNAASEVITLNGVNVGFGYGVSAMNWSFVRTASNVITVTANDRDGLGTYSNSITVANGAIDAVRFYASAMQAGNNAQPYFNNLLVTIPGQPVPAGGVVSNTPVYVRLRADAPVDPAQQQIDLTSGQYALPETVLLDGVVLPKPVYTVTPSAITNLFTVTNTPSVPGAFLVNAANLVSNLVVTAPASAPAAFEISTNSATGFTNVLAIPAGAGTLANLPIYVRIAAWPTVQKVSNNITFSNRFAAIEVTNVGVAGEVLEREQVRRQRRILKYNMRFFPAAGCRSLDAVAHPLFPCARFISFDSPCRCCCPMFTSMPLVAS
jgi:hypothetical protein